MITIYFYMKNEPKQYKTFENRLQAESFMMQLYNDPNCEAYGIER